MEETTREQRAREKRLRDFNDLQDENAGRETGRARRFTKDSAAALHVRADSDPWTMALMIEIELLNFYARLDELDRASLRALEAAQRRAREERERLERLRERAATIDGQRAYLTEDGSRAFFENGQELSPRQRETTRWRGGAPSWEQHQDAHRRLEDAVQEERDIRRYRERIDDARIRLEDGDSPLSADDIAGLEESLEQMPESVRRQLGPRSAQSDYTRAGSATAAPFNHAAAGAAPARPAAGPAPSLSAASPEP
jgi:hypothetical protein